MYEYEIDIDIVDNNKNKLTIKRYYVLPIMGRYQLKDKIDDLLKKDIDIQKYTLIGYNVVNWDEVYN